MWEDSGGGIRDETCGEQVLKQQSTSAGVQRRHRCDLCGLFGLSILKLPHMFLFYVDFLVTLMLLTSQASALT